MLRCDAVCHIFNLLVTPRTLLKRLIDQSSGQLVWKDNPMSINRIFISVLWQVRLWLRGSCADIQRTSLVKNVNTKIRLFRFNYLLDDLNMFFSSVTEIVKEVGLPINQQQHAHHQQF